MWFSVIIIYSHLRGYEKWRAKRAQNWYESLMVIQTVYEEKLAINMICKQYEYPNCAWKVLCFCALTFWPNELMERLH